MRGVIRAARRPTGWVPPGPLPAGDGGRADLAPQADEDLCYLSGEWRLFQKLEGHRWSLDDLVTAWVASHHLGGVTEVLDLGCGLGSVLLMVAWKSMDTLVTGVEAQPARAAMARRSIAFNGVETRCQVIDGDLRAVDLGSNFSLVTGTPPYFPRGTGTEAEADHVSACRFEHRGGVEAYLAAAERHLAAGGVFVMCAGTLEDERVRAAASSLTARGLLHVVPREGKTPLVSVWTFSRESGAFVHERLVVRDASGQWTPAFQTVRSEMGLPPTPPHRK
jgi:tRNA1Val (adenine37-N6)-methyltransferase